MKVVRTMGEITPGRRFAVTIGAFDGIHLGHQALFTHLKDQARQHQASTLAITFDPDPAEVVSPKPPPYLSDLVQKIRLIDQQGIDELCVVHFDEQVKNMTADQFMDQLISSAAVAELVIGHDFAMGHDRQGTRDVLQGYAAAHRFDFSVTEAFMVEGKPVSASRIRHALAQGEVEVAAALLGRAHCITGMVVEGDKRGRQIGFPTANLGLRQRWAIPADGVYVCWTDLEGQKRQSVVNVGLRPTFNTDQRTIESYILDFSGDIYGQSMAIEFLHRLRGEEKFSGIDEIRQAIQRDVDAGRDYFSRLR